MKRIHYLLLGLGVALCIAAAAPTVTVIAPGSGISVTTNGPGNFTIATSGGGANSPTLNGTNVFTGTNTFTGELVVPTSFRTNSGLIYRKLWESPTNIFLSSVVAITANDVTNNGDFVRCTAVQVATIPPLLSPHSQLLYFQGPTPRTNTNPANASMFIGIGTNTNCIGR